MTLAKLFRKGLSPRVRGSPEVDRRERRVLGSIPACAGEPRIAGQATPGVQVYPRVCGGANVSVYELAAS